MKLSPLAMRIQPSPIGKVFERAVELRAQGADLVDFSVGEPDFDTPAHICEAAKCAIDEGHTRYTAVDGTAALKDAIIRKFERDQGLTFTRPEIVVGNGAKPVLAAAVAAVVGEGDEVILPAPAWPSHIGMIDAAGAKTVFVTTSIEAKFKLTPAELAKAITPKSRLLILSSPSNPTGSVYSAVELEALAEVLRKHENILVLSDDLYEHILFDNKKFATLAAVAPDLRDRILTVNGVSKAYAMTGWRIGFAAGPKIWARTMAGLFSQTEGSPCAISQEAARAALDGPQEFLQDWRKIYQTRRNILVSTLAECPALKVNIPEGAFYVFADVSAYLGQRTPNGQRLENDRDFTEYLLQSGVVVTPGSGFAYEGGMRISIATSENEIAKGGQRIVEALKTLQP